MLTRLFSSAAAPPPRRFEFAFTNNPEGRRVLSFPYMSRSDIHWGTQYCRAKKLSHMEQNTWARENDYIGDIYDGTHAMDKTTWNLGPWHRQGMAHALRKADQGGNVKIFQGNHEYGINKTTGENKKPYRHISGKTVYGIDFVIEAAHHDEKGRSVLRLHGDKYDDELFKSEKSKGFWYWLGDIAYTSLYEVDRGIRLIPLLEHFSVAALGKKAVKGVINGLMGINDVIAKALDESGHDVMIYGHSHMPGFTVTPAGKLLINDGCCTEHVNALVRDKTGTYAILTWHSDGIEIEEEPPPGYAQGAKYRVSFKELGFTEALEPAQMHEDQYTARADKITRLLYHTWPAKDVQKIIQTRKQERGGKPRSQAAQTLLPDVPVLKPSKEALNLEHIPA